MMLHVVKFMYRTLSNNPDERSNITYSWVYWDDAFSDEELSQIETLCSSQEAEKAIVVGTNDINEIEKIRKSKIRFFNRNENTNWIFDKLNAVISTINERYYNYNLNGYSDFQYTEYHASEDGKYDWHMDMLHGPNTLNVTRKLSMILCLSNPENDFIGGEFEINNGNPDEPEIIHMKRGRMIFFPSYMIHRVKPITQGIRKTIVVWITGPKFV